MPMSQCDKHTLHCALGSVSNNSHSSMFPTSWIICLDSGLKGLNDRFRRSSCWKACWFGWFSIFWINSRTLTLCNCFTKECGGPGIVEIHVFLNCFTKCFIVNVSRIASLTFRVVLCCNVVFIKLSWSTMSLLNSDIPIFFRWTCLTLITSCVASGCPDLSQEQSFRGKISHWSLENGTFFFHLERQPRLPWWSISNWIWNSFGWLEEFHLSSNFSFWLSGNFPFSLSINCRTQFLVEIEVTCMLCHIGLLQSLIFQLLQHNGLGVSLEEQLRSIEFDRISILSESQDQYRPIFRVLMSLPCVVKVLCETWYTHVNLQDPNALRLRG